MKLLRRQPWAPWSKETSRESLFNEKPFATLLKINRRQALLIKERC